MYQLQQKTNIAEHCVKMPLHK